MMLVSGYPGIGKSALVHEIHKPIARQPRLLPSGKFDQFRRNVPYSALIEAFQDLVRQLLTESDGTQDSSRGTTAAASRSAPAGR